MSSASTSPSPGHPGGITSPSNSHASSSTTDTVWAVQDILAERTSATGGNEVLVVWKPEWIPLANVKPGDVLDAWQAAPKWSSAAMMMKVMLPMAPDSQLQKDVQHVNALYTARYAAQQQSSHPTGPRKQLGTIAKRKRNGHNNHY